MLHTMEADTVDENESRTASFGQRKRAHASTTDILQYSEHESPEVDDLSPSAKRQRIESQPAIEDETASIHQLDGRIAISQSASSDALVSSTIVAHPETVGDKEAHESNQYTKKTSQRTPSKPVSDKKRGGPLKVPEAKLKNLKKEAIKTISKQELYIRAVENNRAVDLFTSIFDQQALVPMLAEHRIVQLTVRGLGQPEKKKRRSQKDNLMLKISHRIADEASSQLQQFHAKFLDETEDVVLYVLLVYGRQDAAEAAVKTLPKSRRSSNILKKQESIAEILNREVDLGNYDNQPIRQAVYTKFVSVTASKTLAALKTKDYTSLGESEMETIRALTSPTQEVQAAKVQDSREEDDAEESSDEEEVTEDVVAGHTRTPSSESDLSEGEVEDSIITNVSEQAETLPPEPHLSSPSPPPPPPPQAPMSDISPHDASNNPRETFTNGTSPPIRLSQLSHQERILQGRYYNITHSDDVVRCLVCSRLGHIEGFCPPDVHDPIVPDCPGCSLQTHGKEDCPNLARSFFPELQSNLRKVDSLATFCYDCGSSSHWGFDCPFVRAGRAPTTEFNIFSATEANRYLYIPIPPPAPSSGAARYGRQPPPLLQPQKNKSGKGLAIKGAEQRHHDDGMSGLRMPQTTAAGKNQGPGPKQGRMQMNIKGRGNAQGRGRSRSPEPRESRRHRERTSPPRGRGGGRGGGRGRGGRGRGRGRGGRWNG